MATVTSISITNGGGDSIKLLPMTDHYAIISNGELVGVVCRANEFQWRVDTIVGHVDGPTSYISLDMALKVASSWHR